MLGCYRALLCRCEVLWVSAEAPDLGLEGVEKPQASEEEQEEEEDLPDEQLAAKTGRQLARKGITFEAKQASKVSGMDIRRLRFVLCIVWQACASAGQQMYECKEGMSCSCRERRAHRAAAAAAVAEAAQLLAEALAEAEARSEETH